MARFVSAARLVCAGLVTTAAGFTQDPASLPRFELASIKLSILNDTGSRVDLKNGPNVVFRNYVLGGILQTAFEVGRLALEAPDWMYGERFDITARVPDETASLDERRRMLQALLIDRFGLAFHRENRARAGFALVVAKSGPKIQPVADVGGHNNDNRPGRIERQRTDIGGLASAISAILRQPVVDETHMEARYDVLLTWSPDGADDGPSIFTAIEDQLGLKLESRKLLFDVLVVDRCRKMPTGN